MRFYASTVVLSLLIPSAVNAYCSEPSEPYCIRAFNTFEDQFSFDSCRREMANFADETNEFITCKNRELQDLADDTARVQARAGEQYDDAVRYWNCKADGGTFC